MNEPPQTVKRIVSKGAYAVRKILAMGLSVGYFVCAISIVLLILSLPLSDYLDGLRGEHLPRNRAVCDRFYYFDLACCGVIFLTPVLLCFAFPLWWGKRKTWEAVHAIQPINSANTADLPAPDTLVRASAEPMQEQEAVLLRAATQTQEKHGAQLVRALEKVKQT